MGMEEGKRVQVRQRLHWMYALLLDGLCLWTPGRAVQSSLVLSCLVSLERGPRIFLTSHQWPWFAAAQPPILYTILPNSSNGDKAVCCVVTCGWVYRSVHEFGGKQVSSPFASHPEIRVGLERGTNALLSGCPATNNKQNQALLSIYTKPES